MNDRSCVGQLAGLTGGLLGALACLLPVGTATAETEEITVTARKRSENLQAVPVAISAFTSADLEVRDVVNLEKLADQTPGLSFATAGSLVNRRAVIRGMSQQTRVGDETNVATFVDGVYVPGFSGAEFFGFDSLERIEVIKGPQSALYGRNSFAGAINYVTAKPRYESVAGARATFGGGERRGLTGYAGGAVIDDVLAVRVDAGTNDSGGSHTNTADGKPLGSAETEFVRLGLRADPLENLTLNLSLSWQQDDVNPVPATLIADDDPRRVGRRGLVSPFEGAAGGGGPIGRLYSGSLRVTSDSYNIDPRSYAGDRRIRRATFDFTLDLGGMSLVGQTAYQDRNVETLGDFNTCRSDIRAAVCNTVSPTAVGTFFGGPLANSPAIVSVLTGGIEDRKEASQDLRLQSAADGPVRWLAGIYVSRERFNDATHRLSDGTLTNADASIIYALADPQPLLDSRTLISNRFYSLYAGVDIDFSEAWTLSIEARDTREKKSADQVANVFPSNQPPTGFQERTFDFFTPRVILNWAPSDAMLWYLSAAKGVKSGGFNPGSVQFPTFDQEENWTYELGSKLTLQDGRLRLNSAVYFIDWDDQQITGTDPDNIRLPITQNVAKTEIKGLEVEALYRPRDWLQANFGLSLIDGKYKEGESASIQFLTDCSALPIPCDALFGTTPITSGSVAGRRVIGTPRSTVNAGLQLNLPMGSDGWEFIGRLDYSLQGKVYIDEANAGYLPNRETVNLRAGMQNDKIALTGFCNNLTDDDTPVFALPPRDILGVPHYYVINRNGRLCGAQFSLRY